ncbi:hypothetical protein EYD10_17001 [Varanus komodoensis]|uniref:zinc finger protein 135-like isoform X2 n=1 Tax=Varanus komodoensis TaxID=61221 RepID=UPI001CF78595|nr:zinc finger protein 135-like isoform X2 [Varanus komodoensis]KAF7236250.1 hypothetical protein EYD10_17001 [Varanus komodoensis]
MGAMAAAGSPEAPVKFEDVIVYFLKDEWKLLEQWQKNLYWEVLTDNYEALVITGHPVTASDISAWVEQCEHLNVKGTWESGAGDSAGALSAANGQCREIWGKKQAEREGPPPAIQGGTGRTEPWHLPRSPPRDEPFPRAGSQAGGPVLAGSRGASAAPKCYRCRECGKRFRLEKLLQIHQEVSRKKGSFPCPKCGVCLPSPSHLLRHQRTHWSPWGKENWLGVPCGAQAPEVLHPCAACGRRFGGFLALLQHQKDHDEAQPWPCRQCGDVFMYRSELLIHEEGHLEEALRLRAGCVGNCICQCSLLLHFSSRGGGRGGDPKPGPREAPGPEEEEESFLCAQCGLLFKLEISLKVHFRYCHEEVPPKRESNRGPHSTPPWPGGGHAEHQGSRPLLGGGQGDAGRPRPPSPPAAPHVCAVCGKSFVFQSTLRKHQRKHRAGKPGAVPQQDASPGRVGSSGGPKSVCVTKRLLKCQECGDKFVYKWQLAAHLKGHGEEGSYDCPYCGKNFGCVSSLWKHHQIHLEEAACRNGPSRTCAGALAGNRQSHALEQLYHCECGKSFARRYLPIHRAFHAGVRYRCLLCGKVCNFRGAAASHCKSHKDLSPCPKCAETGASGPCCCMIERICVAPGPHGREGLGPPGVGLSPRHLYPKHGEQLPSRSGRGFKEQPPTGKQGARPAHPRAQRRKPERRPAFRPSPAKPYKCKDCGKAFAHFGWLTVHRRAHTGEHPFQCAECGKTFGHRGYLDLHWKIHAREGV